ncbi:VP4 [Banna-like virus strain Balaton/2010/HUN]|nr:VP4 [Banna-like virus strain Balaton/2010/HUN]
MAWVIQLQQQVPLSSLGSGLAGPDRTVSDGTFNSMVMPRAVISNEREHASKVRLDKLEHRQARDEKQAASDRQAINDDYKYMGDALKDMVNLDIATEHQLLKLGSSMYKTDHEREVELTEVLELVKENREEVNGILKNQQAITAAERAELIINMITAGSRSAAAAARAAADGIGTIPIFGPCLANGAKIGADVAESVADAAEAIKDSQIIAQLDAGYQALQSMHAAPTDIIKPAVAIATTVPELIGTLQNIAAKQRSHTDIAFKKVATGDVVRASVLIKPSRPLEYESWQIYIIHPSQGSLGALVHIEGGRIRYRVMTQYEPSGDLGFGVDVIKSGSVDHSREGTRVLFHAKTTSKYLVAMLLAMEKIAPTLSQGEVIGYFEQFINLALEPDNLSLADAYHTELANLVSKTSSIDWSVHDEKMHQWLEKKKVDNRAVMTVKRSVADADRHYPMHFNDLRSAPVYCELTTKHEVAGYSVFNYMLGPWNHSGTFKIFVTVDDFNDDNWFSQIVSSEGQIVSSNNLIGAPARVNVMEVDELGEVDFLGKKHDRFQLKIYVKNPHSVRAYRGWEDGHSAPRIEPRTSEHYASRMYDYSCFDRDISPSHLTIDDYGVHPWTDYAQGNWTNVVMP